MARKVPTSLPWLLQLLIKRTFTSIFSEYSLTWTDNKTKTRETGSLPHVAQENRGKALRFDIQQREISVCTSCETQRKNMTC